MQAMCDLKPKEQAVLDFLCASIRENGYAPAVRDICAALHIKSTSTVHMYLRKLEQKGYIERGDGKSRAIRIAVSDERDLQNESLRTAEVNESAKETTNFAKKEAFGKPFPTQNGSHTRTTDRFAKTAGSFAEFDDFYEQNRYRVPILGQVAAGVPILTIENFDGYLNYSTDRHYDRESLFALKITGTSMIEAGIMDGDYVVVEQRSYADNGDIVVAMVDDSATVKRFFKEKGRFRLQPENSAMDPIIVDDVSVLGKVVACIRYY